MALLCVLWSGLYFWANWYTHQKITVELKIAYLRYPVQWSLIKSIPLLVIENCLLIGVDKIKDSWLQVILDCAGCTPVRYSLLFYSATNCDFRLGHCNGITCFSSTAHIKIFFSPCKLIIQINCLHHNILVHVPTHYCNEDTTLAVFISVLAFLSINNYCEAL